MKYSLEIDYNFVRNVLEIAYLIVEGIKKHSVGLRYCIFLMFVFEAGLPPPLNYYIVFVCCIICIIMLYLFAILC